MDCHRFPPRVTKLRMGGDRARRYRPAVAFAASRHVFRFLAADGDVAEQYRRIVAILYDNADRFGERLTLEALAAACGMRSEDLHDRLDQLDEWQVVNSMHNGRQMTSLEDLRLRQFTYDISPAGRRAWEANLAVEALALQAGKLSIERIRALGRRVGALAEAAEADPLDLNRLRASFEDVEQEVARLRDEINGFRKELDDRLRPDDGAAIMVRSTAEFARFRDLVLSHIVGFQNELPALRRDLAGSIERLDRVMEDRLTALAGYDLAPGLSGSSAPGARRQRLADQWQGARAWLHDDPGQAGRWDALDARLVTAIHRLVETAQRIAERDRGRVDRTSRLRALARLSAAATDTDAERLWMAATGRFPSRHLGGPEHDLAAGRDPWTPRVPWGSSEHPALTAYLLKPGGRETTNTRGANVKDTSVREAQVRADRQAARRRRAGRLAGLVTPSPVRISELTFATSGVADELAELLVEAFGQGGSRHDRGAYDELVTAVLPGGQEANGRVMSLRCSAGTLTLPDVLVHVQRTDDQVWQLVDGLSAGWAKVA